MTIFRVVVLKIRARSDFFTIVDPNYIEITRRTNYFTGQFNFSTIFSLDRFQMIYDRRRTWLETWFFAWCCSKKSNKIIIYFCLCTFYLVLLIHIFDLLYCHWLLIVLTIHIIHQGEIHRFWQNSQFTKSFDFALDIFHTATILTRVFGHDLVKYQCGAIGKKGQKNFS